MLKSGMTGLYEFNKYIYCGLLSDSKRINNIIEEIYCNEASEKLLFANFSENMKFIY
jgi:hypothetical protein